MFLKKVVYLFVYLHLFKSVISQDFRYRKHQPRRLRAAYKHIEHPVCTYNSVKFIQRNNPQYPIVSRSLNNRYGRSRLKTRKPAVLFKQSSNNLQLDGTNNLQNDLVNELVKYAATNITTPRLYTLASIATETPTKRAGIGDLRRSFHEKVTCSVCSIIVSTVAKLVKANFDIENIKSSLSFLCERMNPKELCSGIIEINTPIILKIFEMAPNLTGNYICGTILQKQKCSEEVLSNSDWTISLPEPPKIKIPSKIRKKQVIKIAHITDLHMDAMYEQGKSTKCDLPICCRGEYGILPEKRAGRWGEYKACGTPLEVAENVLYHIKKQHPNLNYIYFTGDIPPHNVWNTSSEQITESTKNWVEKLKKYFPDKMVLPAIGNHDSHPVNSFAPRELDYMPNISSKWVYTLMYNQWSNWLPQSVQETVEHMGYYSVLVRPGFRVISINSNVCYTLNLWLLVSRKDPGNQLAWLVRELSKAEEAGERVHILSHIPPGDSECHVQWSREFHKIVIRFSHVITGQFNGHTHYDEIKLFFDKNGDVVNSAMNGGGITTFTDVNPNYRILTVDPNTFEVLDYDTWIYNVTEANLNPTRAPQWYKLYSFTEAYNVPSTRPIDLQLWIKKMFKKRYLIEKYIRFKNKNSLKSEDKCDDSSCIMNELCTIVTTIFNDYKQCDNVKKKLNFNWLMWNIHNFWL